MAINTYATLLSAITDWIARDDLTTRIPDFVMLAETKFNRILLHPRMETRTTLTVDTGSADPEFLDLPADFQTMRSVRLSGVAGKPRLAFMSQTQIEDYRYSIDNISGQPVYFSIVGSQMELAPTPNQNYAVQMTYRTNIPPLLASNTTNWLLTLAPDLYLYGSLLESAAYIKDDGRLAVWSSAFQTCMEQLNIHGERQSFDSGPTSVLLPGITP